MIMGVLINDFKLKFILNYVSTILCYFYITF